ncbi:MAG: 4-hydroxybenzoate octaprenyltransferase [Thermoplasmatota archaeon]
MMASATNAADRSFGRRVKDVLSFVKVEHSLFALPFILAGFVIGFPAVGRPLRWDAGFATTLGLVLVAAVSARTAAMTVNRVIDREIDARNPRTAQRHLATGRMSLPFAVGLAIVAFVVLLVAAWLLNPLCAVLSPLLVGLFVIYPLMKRWSWGCHFVLGLAFVAGVVGGFLAVTGRLWGFADVRPVFATIFLAIAAGAWVAGFDIIYALLDVDVDRAQGIHSIPAQFGLKPARAWAVGLHALTCAALLAAGLVMSWSWPYYVGWALVTALLAYEHWTVDPQDADAVNRAFFRVNAVVGWVALAGLLASFMFA